MFIQKQPELVNMCSDTQLQTVCGIGGALFWVVKWPVCENDHSHQSRTDDKDAWGHTSTPPCLYGHDA